MPCLLTCFSFQRSAEPAPVPGRGARDPLIPVAHGRRAAELLPNSRLTVRENMKHFPHVADPDGFCLLLREFLTATEPARLTLDDVVARLAAGS